MIKFNKEHLRRIIHGINLYNSGYYWECHEELERLWLEEGTDIRYVYWAIIQVAAALLHKERENLIGAQGLIKKAKDKFKKCESSSIESDIMKKFLIWEKFKKIVREIPEDSLLSDFEELKKFKFSSPKKWEKYLI